MDLKLTNNEYQMHSEFMNIALGLAKQSEIDVPVAALIVKEGKIIASAINQKERNRDSTAHAEILVIRQTSQLLDRWRLQDVTIYCTLEPCPMCASAILFSRIPTVVFAAYDTLYGAFGSAIDLTRLCYYYKPDIIAGIEEEKANELIRGFFRHDRDLNC